MSTNASDVVGTVADSGNGVNVSPANSSGAENEFAAPVTMRVKSGPQQQRPVTTAGASGRRSSMIDDLVKQRRDVTGSGSQLRGLGSTSSRGSVVVDLPTIAGLKPLPRSLKAPSQLVHDSDQESRRRSSCYQSVMSGPFSSTSSGGFQAPATSGLSGNEARLAQITPMQQPRRSSISGYTSLTQGPFVKSQERNITTLNGGKVKRETESDCSKVDLMSSRHGECAADSDSGIEETVTKPSKTVATAQHSLPSPEHRITCTRSSDVLDVINKTGQLHVDVESDDIGTQHRATDYHLKTAATENQHATNGDDVPMSGTAAANFTHYSQLPQLAEETTALDVVGSLKFERNGCVIEDDDGVKKSDPTAFQTVDAVHRGLILDAEPHQTQPRPCSPTSSNSPFSCMTSSSVSPASVSSTSVSGTFQSGDVNDRIECGSDYAALRERSPGGEVRVEMAALEEQLLESGPPLTPPPLPLSSLPPPAIDGGSDVTELTDADVIADVSELPQQRDALHISSTDDDSTKSSVLVDSDVKHTGSAAAVTTSFSELSTDGDRKLPDPSPADFSTQFNGDRHRRLNGDECENKIANGLHVTCRETPGERTLNTKSRTAAAAESETEGFVDVVINKGVLGLGFCVAGGKGSSLGDQPIYVKRVFKGSVVQDCLSAGDEIHLVNGESIASLSHFEAWNLLKQLPDGPFTLAVRRR